MSSGRRVSLRHGGGGKGGSSIDVRAQLAEGSAYGVRVEAGVLGELEDERVPFLMTPP